MALYILAVMFEETRDRGLTPTLTWITKDVTRSCINETDPGILLIDAMIVQLTQELVQTADTSCFRGAVAVAIAV